MIEMIMSNSEQLVIFEGCDGAGKSTAAKQFAERFGFVYIHMDASLHLDSEFLPRAFVDAMAPALLGHVPIVMDRCWYSEKIYADAMREGRDRVGIHNLRILDRLSLRSNVVIVHCDPGIDKILESFHSRSDEEYVDKVETIKKVHSDYCKLRQGFYGVPVVDFNYTKNSIDGIMSKIVLATKPIWDGVGCKAKTSGNHFAETLISIEDGLEKPSQYNHYIQFAGCQLNPFGLQSGLTNSLYQNDIPETDLMWCFTSELDEVLENYSQIKKIINVTSNRFLEPKSKKIVSNLLYKRSELSEQFLNNFIDCIKV